ncbi:MAG: PadR family transcriptional regulator [Nanoarchaeota archaeon]
MDKSCVMKGFLEFCILTMINKKNLSGNEIRNELEKRKGTKPSPGTIYPVLKELQEKKLIVMLKDKGKEKRYHITNIGKKEVERNRKIFMAMFKDLI